MMRPACDQVVGACVQSHSLEDIQTGAVVFLSYKTFGIFLFSFSISLLILLLSTANQSNSERRGHGHVRVCGGKPEGHGAYAEGDAGPGERTLSVCRL